LPAITQFILQERAGDECAKISILSHGTGITQATKASLSDPLLPDRVDRVVSLAPCFFIDMIAYELPIGDRPSAEAFFGLLSTYDIKTLWGPIFEAEVDSKMCPSNPSTCAILKQLNAIYGGNYAGSGSMKHYEHLFELGIERKYQEYIATPELYPST